MEPSKMLSLGTSAVKLNSVTTKPQEPDSPEPDLAPLARKLCSILLAGTLALSIGATPAPARTREEVRAALAAKMKDGIARLGTGEEAQVRLTLFDRSVLAGFLGETEEQQFVLVSPEIDLRRTINYDEIKQLHGQNIASGFGVSVGEGSKPLKDLFRLARRKLPGGGRPGTTTGNAYLSKPAVVILVVLAVGVILIGVELGKS
jgi:hypothetical protein